MSAYIEIKIYGDADDVKNIMKAISVGEAVIDIGKEILTSDEFIQALEKLHEKISIEPVEVEESPAEARKTPTDTIDLATEMIINTISEHKRGRRPVNPIRRYLRQVIKYGKMEIPENKMRANDIDVLLRWNIIEKIASNGDGYVIVPTQKVKEIIEKVVLNG